MALARNPINKKLKDRCIKEATKGMRINRFKREKKRNLQLLQPNIVASCKSKFCENIRDM